MDNAKAGVTVVPCEFWQGKENCAEGECSTLHEKLCCAHCEAKDCQNRCDQSREMKQ